MIGNPLPQMQSFLFGAGTDAPTYEALKKKREIIDLLSAQTMAGGEVKNVPDAIGQIGKALIARWGDRRLEKKEDAERERVGGSMSEIIASLGGGGGYSGTPSMSSMGPTAGPMFPEGGQTRAAAPEGFSLDPPPGDFAELFPQVEQQFRLPEGYLSRTARIESGGDPNARNPDSSASGLFQFIDSTAQQYGVNQMDPVSSTMGAGRLAADNAAVLRAALGREPTAGELYLAHQQGAGGAAKLLGNPDAPAVDIVGAEAVRLNGGDASMTARDFAGIWLNKFGEGGGVAGGGASGPNYETIAQLTELMQNPYMSEGQKAVAQAIIAQQMQGADPMRALQMQQAEQQLQLGQMEIDSFGQPGPPEPITPYQQAQLDMQREEMDAPPDPTGMQREYQQAVEQGFQGSILDYQTAKASAGATRVQVGADGQPDPNAALYGELDKAEGKRFSAILDTAPQVGRVAQQIGELERLLANVETGGGAAVRAKLGEWGIATEGLDDTQALQAAIASMVPGQRPPGSGTMSDADLALFKSSIPQIVNQPGGNAAIVQTMKAISAYDQQIVSIANQVANREMTPAQGRDAMAAVANPLEGFIAPPKAAQAPVTEDGIVDFGAMTTDQLKAWIAENGG